MSHKIFIIVLWISCLYSSSILSKDFDSTHELPKVREPDKHRIYFRRNEGYGGINFPVMDYLRYENFNSILVQGYDTNTAIRAFAKNDGYNAISVQHELEYRYMDKFRVFYETRSLVNLKAGKNDQRNLQFKEDYVSLGVAYFHPLSPNFNIGFSLRQVDIEQNTKNNYLLFDLFPPLIGPRNREFSMNVRGTVPGIHIEIKPLRWFEIHIGKQFYNLSGNDTRSTIDIVLVNDRNTNLLFGYFDFSKGLVSYTGEKTTLDFVFRFSSWFATRWGYTIERYNVKYKKYLLYVDDDIPSTMVYSALESSQKQRMEFGSMNITFEFSKSFDE
ncbi:hypothetical protein ND861_04605 [Leptospira sp. 2 VSF19]|uniref:Porin n=1 Tax=Leptospira soteropolitanensis TaxID=2950025 RepID=A0AAW5VH35_9LEPT|nr:hypothetical protein [Leptospira soteropolitanensis]MCW7491931.1 hypothetical protein [Leptospira soteropolitanensis]MCW7499515.1 hypothetical protein [Leptospira soteropolitanensis]MCW7520894.1 hypothetical protein [Leptospira soteropolitanensis]MCW7525619.1 hypothetical protein [Leptospira soteropolitanensis]MCW7529485.1 hypothetical protein [Leptospira soteropolitanensis]